jgi:hypothetical protein
VKTLTLSVAILILLNAAAFAQKPCELTIANGPAFRGLKLGMTPADAGKKIKFGTRRDMGTTITATADFSDESYWLVFGTEGLNLMIVQYTRAKYSNIEEFTAMLTAAAGLPDAWVGASDQELEATKHLKEVRAELDTAEAEARKLRARFGDNYGGVKALDEKISALRKDHAKTEPLAFDGSRMDCGGFKLSAVVPPGVKFPAVTVQIKP